MSASSAMRRRTGPAGQGYPGTIRLTGHTHEARPRRC